jgi:hypothetical protein
MANAYDFVDIGSEFKAFDNILTVREKVIINY